MNSDNILVVEADASVKVTAHKNDVLDTSSGLLQGLMPPFVKFDAQWVERTLES